MPAERRPHFSVVIVSLNGRQRIAMPLDALRRCDPPAEEVIVVDNGSTDGMSPFIAGNYPEVRLIRAPENLGFAGGNNLGILNARGRIVILLNDDTEPEPDWLVALAAGFEADSRVGIGGVRLLYPDRVTIQHNGGMIGPNGNTAHFDYRASLENQTRHEPFDCDYVTGAAFAIRRETIADIGLLDHGFWPIYFEEVDWCTRAQRRGWKIRQFPASTVIHHESQTTVVFSPRFLKLYMRNRLRYLLKHRRGLDMLRTLRHEARWWMRDAQKGYIWPMALAYAWAAIQWREVRDTCRREGLE